MHCTKGIGRDHAKWSPVATATYRLLPEVVLNRSIMGEEAEKLKVKCPLNVFDIEDSKIVVARPRDCSVCRECIRDPSMASSITLTRVRNHFLCNISFITTYNHSQEITSILQIILEINNHDWIIIIIIICILFTLHRITHI